MPETNNLVRLCSCGCNKEVSRWTEQRHKKNSPLEFPSPPKRRRIAHFHGGRESLIIRPGKRKQSRAGNNSSTSHSLADAGSSSSGHIPPRLHSPPFEFNPSLPLLDPPPALLAGDALTKASGPFVDNVLLDLHARLHRTTDQSDDDDDEVALEVGAAEAFDFVDHETGDFWNEEDVAMEGDTDPHEGIVSDWDLLTEEFIAEAEELGKFEHSLFHASRLSGFFVPRRAFYLGP